MPDRIPDRIEDNHTSLERIARGQLEMSGAVPVSSYPVEVESDGGATPTLLSYWTVLRRRRWTVLGILALVVLTVMIGTLKERPVYEAKAVLQIDRESPNVLNFQDLMANAEMDPYDDSYLETAYRLLQSRSLAYRVIKQLNLTSSPEFAPVAKAPWYKRLWPGSSPAPKAPLSAEEQIEPRYTSVIDRFLGKLQVDPVRRSQLVEIVYDSYDPATSARVANTVASNYIDMNLESKWQATQKASDWLSQQLVGLKAKLEKSEEDLQRYATDNSLLFLDEKQSMNSQKLQQLQEEATRAEADLIEKESLYNQIKDGNFASVPGILDNKLYQDLSMKLSDLKRQYSDLTATFAPAYPSVQRVKSQIDETQEALDAERASFAQRVTDDYKAAANRKRLLDEDVGQQTRDFNEVAEKSIQYNILKREADTNKQLYEGLLQRMKEASVSAGLRASNVSVVDPAEVPLSASKPRVLFNLTLAGLGGLTLGIGFAFFQDYLDDTVNTPADVQRDLRLPVLGVIPAANSGGKNKRLHGYGYSSRKSLPSQINAETAGEMSLAQAPGNGTFELPEAYRSLRTSVLLSTSGKPPRSILVTSGHPGEGKTTTAVYLAMALEQLGGKVLVVDSDMRRPRVSSLLKLPTTAAGLSTYLTGQYSLADSVTPTSIPNLDAVLCGPIPPNPAELLSSGVMRRFLAEVQQQYDYVLLDSPPVLHVSDARILAGQVDAVILVVQGGKTPRAAVRAAREQLRHATGNLIGVTLNNVDFGSLGYDYYYRHYGGYGDSEQPYGSQPAQPDSEASV